jgi:hypothetical protein
MTTNFRRIRGCALALVLGTASAWAGADDYQFEPVSTDLEAAP